MNFEQPVLTNEELDAIIVGEMYRMINDTDNDEDFVDTISCLLKLEMGPVFSGKSAITDSSNAGILACREIAKERAVCKILKFEEDTRQKGQHPTIREYLNKQYVIKYS